jgi:hypothetical protein
VNERTVCVMRAHIDQHFAGTITVDAERAMRAHLPSCAGCTRAYERHLLLAKLDPDAPSAQDRMAIGLGLRQKPVRRELFLAGVLLPAAAAIFLLIAKPPSVDEGFHARGSGAIPASSHVVVYRVHGKEPPTVARDTIGRHDELAFSYENGGKKSNLMIFAVDEHRHVFWFYPAWTNASENPLSVAAETTPGSHPLPEAITQSFDGARLTFHGLFSDRPLSVKEVESVIEAAPPSAMDALPISGAIDGPSSFGVVP